MTKIGIFGDSFADVWAGHTDLKEMQFYGWPYLLDGYTPDIYAFGGASLFYAYDNFLNYHHLYEKNIFLVPDLRRYPENIFLNRRGDRVSIPGYESAVAILNNPEYYNLEIHDQKKVEILKDSYVYLDQTKSSYEFGRLTVEEIKRIRPDTLIISTAYYIDDEKKIKNTAGDSSMTMTGYLDIMISNICNIPYQTGIVGMPAPKNGLTDFPHRKIKNFPEIRCTCHFSKEINQQIAQDIFNALKLGIWNPSPNLDVPHAYGLDYYYNTTRNFWDKILNG